MTTIYFATNRNPNDPVNPTDFGDSLSTAGQTDLRFGKAEVTGDDYKNISIEVVPETLVSREDADANDFSEERLGSVHILDELRTGMSQDDMDTVIYIHGFDYTFEEAVSRTAKLKDYYDDRPMNWFLFTWPSDGRKKLFRSYQNDRDDAESSGKALSRGMMKVASYLRKLHSNDYCDQSIHLMAHSMGTFALRHAIQSIWRDSSGNIRRLFDQIVLAAPDEDDDAFEKGDKYGPLHHFADRVTVYHNPVDLALMVSDATKGNPDRLGAGGPRNTTLLPDKVTVVNTRHVHDVGKDPQAHQYYRKIDAVREDILQVLDGEEQADIGNRRPGSKPNSYFLGKKSLRSSRRRGPRGRR